ncbi:alpha/beta hydrolase family protein [Acidobacteriota bacterium]
MLIREGFINPEAIGIQGHSWGGYQIAYMVTQTNIFAAAEAGAPVSNMTSAYGGIRWGSGMVRQFQYERSQSRLGDTLWRVPLRYIDNSPLFWADKVRTPLLMMHNDEDGAVPWYQSIEFIMALRRLEKEAYMFNYNGEKHGLRKRVNQVHWTKCMQEFFDHHLKGAPAPGWMKEGIKAWDPAAYEESQKTGD